MRTALALGLLLGCASGHRPAPATGGAGDASADRAADDAPCAANDDCTFTRYAPGACCPMLCAPRAVTKAGAGALEAHGRSCEKKQQCPQPLCRPPRETTIPACAQGRCVAKVLAGGPQ